MKLTLVLASQRSGSTLLCNDIASLGGLGAPSESLLSIFRKKDGARPGPAEVKQALAKGMTSDVPDVAAVKLMANYAPRVFQCITGEDERRNYFEACMGFVQWAKTEYDAVNLVVLIRENSVDQAISRVMASRSGVYHARGASDAPDKELDDVQIRGISREVLRTTLRVINEAQILKRVADAQSGGALFLTYEQIVADPEACAGALRDHAAKVGMHAHREQLQRSLKKVVSGNVSQRLKSDMKKILEQEVIRFLD